MRAAKLWKRGMTTLAEDTTYISMPTSYGTPQALRCGDTWIPLLPIRRVGGIRNLIPNMVFRFLKHDQTRIERLGDGIAYARLPEFDWSNYENVSQEGWAIASRGIAF